MATAEIWMFSRHYCNLANTPSCHSPVMQKLTPPPQGQFCQPQMRHWLQDASCCSAQINGPCSSSGHKLYQPQGEVEAIEPCRHAAPRVGLNTAVRAEGSARGGADLCSERPRALLPSFKADSGPPSGVSAPAMHTSPVSGSKWQRSATGSGSPCQ